MNLETVSQSTYVARESHLMVRLGGLAFEFTTHTATLKLDALKVDFIVLSSFVYQNRMVKSTSSLLDFFKNQYFDITEAITTYQSKYNGTSLLQRVGDKEKDILGGTAYRNTGRACKFLLLSAKIMMP